MDSVLLNTTDVGPFGFLLVHVGSLICILKTFIHAKYCHMKWVAESYVAVACQRVLHAFMLNLAQLFSK